MPTLAPPSPSLKERARGATGSPPVLFAFHLFTFLLSSPQQRGRKENRWCFRSQILIGLRLEPVGHGLLLTSLWGLIGVGVGVWLHRPIPHTQPARYSFQSRT